MEKVHTTRSTRDDIVFENRNKAYGAYELRQSYEARMGRALLLTALLLAALAGLPSAIRALFPGVLEGTPVKEPYRDERPVRLTDLYVMEAPKMASLAVAPLVKTVENPVYEVVPDHEARPGHKPATVDQLRDAVSGLTTQDGTVEEVPPVVATDGSENGAIVLNDAPANQMPFVTVEEMPEFPGGQAAMFKFIAKHLRYPQSAQAQRVAGMVYVGFVISPAGAVTEVQVLKGIDAACDAEAVRVISRMPAWKPGRQSGRNVPVRYSLPIRFSIQ